MKNFKVNSFVIYNSKLGPREGDEEKKIMFYYPDSEKLMTKINNVGLFEALVQFTQTFQPNNPCELVAADKQKYVFYNPEPDYWMVLSMIVHQQDDESLKQVGSYGEAIKCVCQSLLRCWCERFDMVFGGFNYLLETRGQLIFKEKLNWFFTRFLNQIENSFCFDILSIYGGLGHKLITKMQFLDFQSYISSLQDKLPSMKYCVALYEGNLIYSNLTCKDTRNLVHILTTHTSQATYSLFNRPEKGRLNMYQLQHGRSISGIFEGSRNSNHIYIKEGEKLEKFQLFIYQAFHVLVCLLISKLELPYIDSMKILDEHLGAHLSLFSSRLNSSSKPASNTQPHINYIHFNKHQLAVESSCHDNVTSPCAYKCSLPSVVLQALCQLENVSPNSEDEEFICKIHNDYWIASKSVADQKMFVIGNHKNSNLIYFSDEADKVISKFEGLQFAD